MTAPPVLRDRLLGRRWLVLVLVAWGVTTAALPSLAGAEPIPPAPSTAGVDLETLRAVLERRVVRARLAELGVSEADADRLLARLDPEERAELAQRADEVEAGGSGAAVLAVAILVAMVVVLVLELLGRRVVSRPS